MRLRPRQARPRTLEQRLGTNAGDLQEPEQAARSPRGSTPTRGAISLRELFLIFLKSGFAFGAGMGMVAFLQDELVDKRKAISRTEFLAMYGLGRIVPSGTVTALAVALGEYFNGLPGSAVAVVAMILPSFVLTVALVVPYAILSSSGRLDVVNVTLLPAALAALVVGAIKVGREFAKPSVELVLMVGACVVVVITGVTPPVVLIAGGVIGAIAIRGRQEHPG